MQPELSPTASGNEHLRELPTEAELSMRRREASITTRLKRRDELLSLVKPGTFSKPGYGVDYDLLDYWVIHSSMDIHDHADVEMNISDAALEHQMRIESVHHFLGRVADFFLLRKSAGSAPPPVGPQAV